MGGSYGGYATLAGLTFTPEVFACGVDIVGPSNLETLLSTIPPYWAPMVKIFHERMGNPETEEGLALLKAASPLYKADRIEKPLLIAQGANDPRVKQAESDQIVGAMKGAGIPVTYVLYPDEGHGFARPENSIAFYAIAENFLAECLGGRAEPLGDVLAPSTARIVEGEEYVKGLAETSA
jgi:dipeptidyl aminopeptidase/acylaminoacyl peptidase